MANAAFWDNLAERYAAQPVADPDAFDRKIEITRGLMRPDHTLLEIGCGTGSLALRLADIGAQIHGLDLSGEMLRIARDKAEAAGVENVHFHQGPFDETFGLFGPEQLDGLLAFSILHLVPDLSAALEQIHSLLKPGAYFVSSTVCLGRSKWLYGPMLAVMRLFGKAPVVKLLTPDEVTEAMKAAGFVEVTARDVGAKDLIHFVVARKADR